MSRRRYRAARERLARERGTVRKDRGGRIPVALVYPNVYAVGMANLGFLAVYDLLNRHEDVLCERVFLPDPEELEEMARTGIRPFSLESQSPLDTFALVAFSLSYENDYPHAAALLSMAGIPPARRDRSGEHPLILAGGPAVFLNPEPLADLVDFFVLGEAEELLGELLEEIRRWVETGRRSDLLHSLPRIEGLYVPSLYRPRYAEDGTLAAFEPEPGVPSRVRRRWTRDLDRHPVQTPVVAPDTEFSGMFLVEVVRGCRHRCCFCSTSSIYRPLRYRSMKALEPSFRAGTEQGLRLGLVSACLGDHPEMDALCAYRAATGARISGPSLRLDSLGEDLLTTDQISRGADGYYRLIPFYLWYVQ